MATGFAEYFISFLLMQIGYVAGQGEYDLLENLFLDYNKLARPRLSANETITVSIGFSLTLLNKLDLKNQAMTTSGWLTIEWMDEFMKWKPESYHGIEKVVVPSSKVWLPDIAIDNSVGAIYDSGHVSDFRVTIYNTGTVVWEPGGTFTTTCDTDISSYPFDHQTCTMIFTNWMYTMDQVKLVINSTNIDRETYTENGEWDIEYTKIKSTWWALSTKTDEVYSEVEILIHVRRRYLYYMVNMMIPCLMMSLLVLVVFQLPPDSGEKVSLGVTVLLAFSVFQLMIAENIPSTSKELPIIGIYMLIFMGESTFSVAISVLVLNFHHRTEYKPPPDWLRTVVLDWLAGVVCMKRQRNNKVNCSSEHSNSSDVESRPKKSKQQGGSLERVESEQLTNTFRIDHDSDPLTPTIQITSDIATASSSFDLKPTGSPMLNQDVHSFQAPKLNRSFQNTMSVDPSAKDALSPDLAKSAVKLMRSIANLENTTGRHSKEEILAVIRDTYKQICQQRKDEELETIFENEWKRIAKTVDKFFFYVTTCLIIISSTIVFCFIPISHPDVED